MLNQNHGSRPWVAIPTAFSLILSPAVPLVSAPVPAYGTTAQAQSGVQAAETQPALGAWPKWFETTSGGTVVMYTPQVNSWDGQKKMVFRAAVSFTYKESQKPDLGTVKVDAKTKVSLEDRLVIFSDLTVTEANFPNLARDKVQEVTTELQDAMPEQDRILSLDRVLEGVDKSQILPKNLEGVKADSASNLFEHDACHPRRFRRRADLEPHQRRRFEVRRQHELGRLRAHAHQSFLSAT